MKASVSLSDDDVRILDEFARERGLSSRSAAVQHAVHLLRTSDLDRDYAAAWDEWADSGDSALWEGTAADGVTDAPR